jgi:hypothetical protein
MVFSTRSRQHGLGSDYFTAAVDAGTGGRLWSRWYGSPDPASSDVPSAIDVSVDGSEVFVTGSVTIAYDSVDGTTRWKRRYDRPAHSLNARAMAVSPDGSSVFVTGDSFGFGTGDDIATVAYDSVSGAQQWVRRYSGNDDGNEEGEAITTSPSGSAVYVTGISSSDYLTLAYDASTGSRIWRKRYDGPGNGFDVAVWIVASPDASRVFVTGSSDGDGTAADYATIAYRA